MRLAGTLLTWSVLNVTCGSVLFCVLQNKSSYACVKVHVLYTGAHRFGRLKFRATTYIQFDSATSKVRTVRMIAA